MASIEGRNEDGSWFRLIDPKGISCWVSRMALEVPANWASWKVLAYPLPPPTPKEQATAEEPASDACAQYQGVPECLAHPECRFDRLAGVCKSK
jgi:hypothetical protein